MRFLTCSFLNWNSFHLLFAAAIRCISYHSMFFILNNVMLFRSCVMQRLIFHLTTHMKIQFPKITNNQFECVAPDNAASLLGLRARGCQLSVAGITRLCYSHNLAPRHWAWGHIRPMPLGFGIKPWWGYWCHLTCTYM